MWDGTRIFPLRKDFPLEGLPTDVPDVAFTGVAPLQGGPFVTAPTDGTTQVREPRRTTSSCRRRRKSSSPSLDCRSLRARGPARPYRRSADDRLRHRGGQPALLFREAVPSSRSARPASTRSSILWPICRSSPCSTRSPRSVLSFMLGLRLRLLRRAGTFEPREIFDTMIASRLCGVEQLGLARLSSSTSA